MFYAIRDKRSLTTCPNFVQTISLQTLQTHIVSNFAVCFPKFLLDLVVSVILTGHNEGWIAMYVTQNAKYQMCFQFEFKEATVLSLLDFMTNDITLTVIPKDCV
jgi:hypothetical protein